MSSEEHTLLFQLIKASDLELFLLKLISCLHFLTRGPPGGAFDTSAYPMNNTNGLNLLIFSSFR